MLLEQIWEKNKPLRSYRACSNPACEYFDFHYYVIILMLLLLNSNISMAHFTNEIIAC